MRLPVTVRPRLAHAGLIAILLAASACAQVERRHPKAVAATAGHPVAADTTAPEFSDSMLTLDSATVVLFWTTSADTFSASLRDEAAADLKASGGWAADYLRDYNVAIVATHARGVYVNAPGGVRRFIDFRGLDYPFGFVLIDPGYPERFLTGLVGEDDLRDELVDYFDLEEGDSTSVLRTRAPAGPARTSSREASSAVGANGFCRKMAPGGNSPCWTITSGV